MSDVSSTQPTSEPTSRLARRVQRKAILPEYPPNRWAIIVGISNYQYEPWNLRFADDDAIALHDLILDPRYGGFEPERIKKLINEDATTANITSALRGFLQDATAEDLVLIYFACHGGPDPKRPDNIYLYTHDTDPYNFSGSALPMREINLSLQENLKAQRIVLLADTCHSGAIPGTRSANGSAVVNEYFKQLSKAQEASFSLMTSASASETAAEDIRWGGGHGVFTYYVLEGLKGAADRGFNKNGIVTVGKLFDYVQRKVKADTKGNQNPTIGPDLDRDLPLAITSERDAQDHLTLGKNIFHLGRVLSDRSRYQETIRQFGQALEFAIPRRHFPEVYLFKGRTLTALEEYEDALAAFKTALKQDENLHDVHFYRGITYAKQRRAWESRACFRTYLDKSPENEKSAWAKAFVDESTMSKRGTQHHALIIGIDRYQHPDITDLQGSINDVNLMQATLKNLDDIDIEVTTLVDEQATRENILGAVRHLRDKVTLNTTVIVHFSGRAEQDENQRGLLIVHDSVPSKVAGTTTRYKSAIPAQLLINLLDSIPAKHKIVLFDTDPFFPKLAQIAQRVPNVSLFIGASKGQQSHELYVDDKSYGVFSYNLAQQIERISDINEPTFASIVTPVIERVSQQGFQTPRFYGDLNIPIFSNDDYYLSLFDFAQRRTFGDFDLTVIRNLLAHVKQLPADFPSLQYQLGRALVEKEVYDEAARTLDIAVKQGDSQSRLKMIFTFAHALFGAEKFERSIEYLQEYADTIEIESEKDEGNLLIKMINQYQAGAAALLVGIENYSKPEMVVPGVKDELEALKHFLIEGFDFKAENIVIITDEAATHQKVEAAFIQLIDQSIEVPAFFYFAGRGSVTAKDEPTLVCYDSRETGSSDLRLSDLAILSQRKQANLITLIDAGWSSLHPRGQMPDSRSGPSPMMDTSASTTLSTLSERDLESKALQVGQLSMYDRSLKYQQGFSQTDLGQFGAVGLKKPKQPKSLTQTMLQRAQKLPPEMLTYAHLIRDFDPEAEGYGYVDEAVEDAIIVGGADRQISFSIATLRDRILKTFARFELTPIIGETKTVLRRVIEQQNGNDPEGHLNLGIAHMIMGEYDKAIQELNASLRQRWRNPITDYYLGRTRVEQQQDLGRAVNDLQKATEQNPENVAAFYYLGLALEMMVNQEIFGQAETAYQTYLDQGAPLDHRREVLDFLTKRRTTEG